MSSGLKRATTELERDRQVDRGRTRQDAAMAGNAVRVRGTHAKQRDAANSVGVGRPKRYGHSSPACGESGGWRLRVSRGGRPRSLPGPPGELPGRVARLWQARPPPKRHARARWPCRLRRGTPVRLWPNGRRANNGAFGRALRSPRRHLPPHVYAAVDGKSIRETLKASPPVRPASRRDAGGIPRGRRLSGVRSPKGAFLLDGDNSVR